MNDYDGPDTETTEEAEDFATFFGEDAADALAAELKKYGIKRPDEERRTPDMNKRVGITEPADRHADAESRHAAAADKAQERDQYQDQILNLLAEGRRDEAQRLSHEHAEQIRLRTLGY